MARRLVAGALLTQTAHGRFRATGAAYKGHVRCGQPQPAPPAWCRCPSEVRVPFFSLVVSTRGRSHELRTLFDSLSRQTFRDFELVLVDQNGHNELSALVDQGWGFPVKRLERPAEQGLSRGRNVGWRAASGEYVCFPDDDCWYDPDFLEYSARQLAETGADVLTGRAAKEDGTSINGRFAHNAIWVTAAHQVWTTQIEWVAFFRRSLLVQLGGYDEDVGIGALTPWQACEGQDIVLRALELGARCYYDPSLTGRHAEIVLDRPSASTRKKALGYARGMGHVLRKHRFGIVAVLYWICRPLTRAGLSLAMLKPVDARYYVVIALGRLEGAVGRPSYSEG